MAKDQRELELWERQPGESSTAYTHFCYYRDMRYPKAQRGSGAEESVMDGTIPYEKRSLRKMAANLGMNKRTLGTQCDTWEWVKRCEAYDAYIDKQVRASNEAAIRKMNQEHALLAQQMIRKATRRLLQMPDNEIGASDLVRMVDTAVKVERLSRGESTENQAVTHGGELEVKRDDHMDLSGLSNEELDQFEKLFRKVGGGSTSDG